MAKKGISTISWNICRLVNWQLLLLLPPRLRLSKRRETRRVENISMMEFFRFSLKKFLSSDGILVYLLMALRCGISRLDTTNLLNFCYIQKFSKPFLFIFIEIFKSETWVPTLQIVFLQKTIIRIFETGSYTPYDENMIFLWRFLA